MSEYFKIREVCERTDTQPYVLRFWESEFPRLAPRKNDRGQNVYSSSDIQLIERIKELLYAEEYTIAGARKMLESERKRRGGQARRKRATAGVETLRKAAGAHSEESAAVLHTLEVRGDRRCRGCGFQARERVLDGASRALDVAASRQLEALLGSGLQELERRG